jgi:hypothetical protein
MSADQHKQIGVLRGARSHQLRDKQNEIFGKSQEKGPIRKILKPIASLSLD